MANKKGSHQLTRADRIKIEALLKEGLSKAKIAAHLGVHRSTIYNELKRGAPVRCRIYSWWESSLVRPSKSPVPSPWNVKG